MKHRQPLSVIPWNDLRVGDQLISAVNNEGVLIDKFYDGDPSDGIDVDYLMLRIRWAPHSKTSLIPHNLADSVVTK